MIDRLLQFLGLSYDSERWTLKPPQRTHTQTTYIRETDTPPNLVYHSGRAFTQVDNRDGFEADIYTDNILKRNGQLTDKETDEIRTKKLDIKKAAEIKWVWAANVSASNCAKQFSKRGYGKRTIEKYYSVFNSEANK